MHWMSYHIGEEFFIAALCAAIAHRAFSFSRAERYSREIRSRAFLIGSGFAILGISSAIHAFIHVAGLSENLLYQTLLGYCVGLLTLIVGIFSEKPWTKRAFPLLYLPLLVLLHPGIYTAFPIFGEFRPLLWVLISYFSGTVCIIYIAVFYRTRAGGYVFSSMGHGFICLSAIVLFFPASIGSEIWSYGHLMRPLGFLILFFSMTRKELSRLKGSILYKAVAAFSLIAAIPLLMFGAVIFYETISPMDIVGRRLVIFALLMVTLSSALIFGLGMMIRLIRPILRLKDSVGSLVERGLEEKLDIGGSDEIGELSSAFSEMVVKLRHSISEQDRLSRLAATGELSATLAHEIKNPLNAIGGAASYIRKNFKGSLINEFTGVITSEVERINKLTSNLLDFAKPQRPEPAPSDLNRLVGETVGLLRQECEEHGPAIETDLRNDVPIVSFDYNQIKQVLINLILNSLDAVGKDGRIRVSTRASNGNVLLSVEDNGKGIGEEDMKKIFNPFFTTKTRGTGLGLAMSKKVAREHGGDILVESVPGRGSTFTVLLPARQ